MAEWRFKPRPEVARPHAVDTVATMTFLGKQAQDAGVLRARCAVPDLAALVRYARRQESRRLDFSDRGRPNSRLASDASEARQAASAYAATQR